jgi:hypothetical protein
MWSPQALIRSVVQRTLLAPNPDNANNDVALRLGLYGEPYTQPLVRKAHNLADEGSYYTTNNAQTGIVPTYATSFAATTPLILIYNGGTQRVYLDYIALVPIVAEVVTTTIGYLAIQCALDATNRYTSGGTNLTANIINVNGAVSGTPGVSAYCGAITATAATAAVRNIIGMRIIRPGALSTAANVVGDMHLLNFGSVEGAVGSIVPTNANIMPQALPPVVIPPGWSFLLNLWVGVSAAPSAGTWAPEIGFWVR